MKHRWKPLLDRLPPGPVVGVELGVYRGHMSQELLKREDLFLWLVDIKVRDEAWKLTEFATSRRDAIWLPSVKAAKRFEDESLDFVFIDADHSDRAVREDIAAWLPKVKIGGLLCGHDYGKTTRDEVAVTDVVDELFPDAETDIDYTWFVRKLTPT